MSLGFTVSRWTGLLAVVGGLVLFTGPLHGRQDPGPAVLDGQVLGPSGAPVADLAVVLHRVTSDGGAVVGQANSDEDGRFRIESGADSDEGVYFVAVRYEGQVYIGPMIEPPFPPGSEYVVQIGAATALPPAGAPATTPAPPAGRSAGTAPALVIGAIGLVFAAFAVMLARRPPARRRLLIRLAREEENAAQLPRTDALAS